MTVAFDRTRSLVRWEGDDRTVGTLDGVFYPVLKPVEWVREAARQGAVVRPLTATGAIPEDAPQVAYAVDLGESVAFLDRDALPALLETEEIHRVALGHLRQLLACEASFEEVDAETARALGLRALFFSGSYYASEGILLPEILREAQQRLGAEFVAVAAPARGQLAFLDGGSPPEALAGFAAATMNLHFDGPEAPISTLVFAACDGQLIGRLDGLDEIRAQVGEAAFRRQQARAERVTALEHRRPEADGDTVLLTLLCEDVEESLPQVEALVRDWAHRHRDDESLSGRVLVELSYPEAQRELAEAAGLHAAAHDLAGFLTRQLAGLGAGPREGEYFTIGIDIDWRDAAAAAPRRKASSPPDDE